MPQWTPSHALEPKAGSQINTVYSCAQLYLDWSKHPLTVVQTKQQRANFYRVVGFLLDTVQTFLFSSFGVWPLFYGLNNCLLSNNHTFMNQLASFKIMLLVFEYARRRLTVRKEGRKKKKRNKGSHPVPKSLFFYKVYKRSLAPPPPPPLVL